jgi:protein gp37
MAEKSSIQYVDGSLNIMMGCEGCELSSKTKGDELTCYAEVQTNRWHGKKGWPVTFLKPELFMHRLPKAVAWSDLTGQDRETKPWLNGMPRIIFLNDMGDTFTAGLPKDWFAEALEPIRNSPHHYLSLTKWPYRFAEFSERHCVPTNVWPGTSVTSEKFLFRIKMLQQVKGGGPKWISAEPQEGTVDYGKVDLTGIDWIVFGGESGPFATEYDLNNLQSNIRACMEKGLKVFVKQLGAKPTYQYDYNGHERKPVVFNDSHGGDWDEWNDSFKIRQMPSIRK